MAYTNYTTRRKLSSRLEQLLSSVKDCSGEYEYEQDYEKVLEKLQHTNPFSVLVFYERSDSRCSIAQSKQLNPHVPKRILTGGFASYEQFYFIPELKESRRGNYLGSGYRSTQSVYALALAQLSQTQNVPTHILLCDRKHKVNQVLSSRTLIVQPHEVLQTVSYEVADEILKNTRKAYAQRGKNYDVIESIAVTRTPRR